MVQRLGAALAPAATRTPSTGFAPLGRAGPGFDPGGRDDSPLGGCVSMLSSPSWLLHLGFHLAFNRGYYRPLWQTSMSMSETQSHSLLDPVRIAAERAAVFASVETVGTMLRCRAAESGAEAWYRVCRDNGRWYVELATPDRWLSESIEADLMHHGDPIEELVEEELVEIESEAGDSAAGRPAVQHFRSDDMLYVFRSPVGAPGEEPPPSRVANLLRAYEAAFRELGDMSAGLEEE